jgi:alpha-tubulin suppressor-like RCC1 family protein
VVNPDGGTAIRVNALTYSAFPAFSTDATLDRKSANVAFGVSISATSDSNISYSNTSTLPAGTALLANGWFYGNVNIGVETTYSFTVKATDVELQDTSRTFSLTVGLGVTPGLYSFGRGTFGSNGQNDGESRSSPVQIGTESTWNKFSAGYNNALATKTNGTLWGWGMNNVGQLGLGNTVGISSPTQVGTGTNWNLITSHAYFSLATKTDGTLWAWGDGAYGVLGRSNVLSLSSPTQVGASTNWNGQIIAISNNSAAVKTDGTLWTWGRNTSGVLGIGVVTARSSPVQVGTGTNWSSIAMGENVAAAIKTDGTLWAWCSNQMGQLGQNTVGTNRSSPIQVGATTNWSIIHCGTNSCFAIKTDGTLWAWGYNPYGELGFNDRVYRSSPTQVGSATNWSLIKSESSATMAIKTDGTLWCWGTGSTAGASGSPNPFNDTVYRSSPTQVGTLSNWVDLDVGAQSKLIRAS